MCTCDVARGPRAAQQEWPPKCGWRERCSSRCSCTGACQPRRVRSQARSMGVVQVRVTPKTKNPFTIKALSISGVTWNWHVLNHAREGPPNRYGDAPAPITTYKIDYLQNENRWKYLY